MKSYLSLCATASLMFSHVMGNEFTPASEVSTLEPRDLQDTCELYYCRYPFKLNAEECECQILDTLFYGTIRLSECDDSGVSGMLAWR